MLKECVKFQKQKGERRKKGGASCDLSVCLAIDYVESFVCTRRKHTHFFDQKYQHFSIYIHTKSSFWHILLKYLKKKNEL